MEKLKIVWVQDASPIGFITTIETIEKLKKLYKVDYFRLYDKGQIYNEYYEEECNLPFIEECEKFLGKSRHELFMFYDINEADEIWGIDELPFSYETL